jgi:LytR cell envelope-related transcriptional attenuator
MVSLIDDIGRYVAFGAALAILLLIPLYVSQRRDISRLRQWRDREPDHPGADLTASEALLDRAEAELQALLAERGEPVTVTSAPAAAAPATAQAASAAPAEAPATPAEPTPATPPAPIPAAQRVTGERPALARITVERAALEPHPRWRRLASRLGTPRALALIALAAVVLAVGALAGSRVLLDTGGGGSAPAHRGGPFVPGQVTVAVLNGTSQPGLAATVGETLRRKGFKEGTIATARRSYQQTVVMFGRGSKKAAERVASVLGATPVQPIDRTTREIAGAADVVVIAGRDRAKS